MARFVRAVLATSLTLTMALGVLPASSATATSGPVTVTVVGGVTAVSSQVAAQVTNAGGTVRRIGGSSRFDTAGRVATDAFPGGVDLIYLATGSQFPDALAAAAAAGGRNAPVLLTQATALPRETADALARLRPRRVIIVGGQNAVSDAVATAVRALGVATVDRLGGANRYATAIEVSRDAFPAGSDTVYLATGANFPDALAAAAAAGHHRAPVLLSATASLPANVEAELRRLSPARVVLAGGVSALSDTVANRVRQALPRATVQRVGGSDRYQTAALLAGEFTNPTGFYLTSGTGFADALVAAAVAGSKGQPVLLTPAGSLAEPVRRRLPGGSNPPVAARVELPLLPPGKTAADYPQTTPTALVTAIRADLLAAFPAPNPRPLVWEAVPGIYDPKPRPSWAGDDPNWSSRACAALRDAGVTAMLDSPTRHYQEKDWNPAQGGGCHVEAEHTRNRAFVQISFPGHFLNLADLDTHPDFVRSNFAGVVVYTTGNAAGYVSYGNAADGTHFSLSFVDADNRLAGRMAMAATLAAWVSLQLAAK
jgi:putative cell wall-binding protein